MRVSAGGGWWVALLAVAWAPAQGQTQGQTTAVTYDPAAVMYLMSQGCGETSCNCYYSSDCGSGQTCGGYFNCKLVGKLAASYTSPALGTLGVIKKGTTVTFDFGEFKSDVATKKNPDGTIAFVTITPSLTGLEFLPGADGKTLGRSMSIEPLEGETLVVVGRPITVEFARGDPSRRTQLCG